MIITTPDAPHPKAQIHKLDFDAAAIAFRWLNSESQPVDSGGSVAPFTPTGNPPTTAELRAAITAATD